MDETSTTPIAFTDEQLERIRLHTAVDVLNAVTAQLKRDNDTALEAAQELDPPAAA